MMQHRFHLSINVRLVMDKPPLPMVHGAFTRIILRVQVIRPLHLIQNIFNDFRAIVFVRKKTIRQFIVESSAIIIATFEPIDNKPLLFPAGFFVNSKPRIPLA